MDVYSLYVLAPISILSILILWYLLKCLLPKPLVSDFKNKFVLITGCDSGFGKMSAIRLDQMGFRVIGACLTEQGKENLESVCSDRLVGMVMDVTNSKQIQDVFEKVKKLVADKGLWAVVNNAGIMSLGPIEWYTMDDFRKMADVNLWGLIEVTKTFLPLVKKAEGRIVNFSSVAGLLAVNNMAPYCITKYGIEAYSDSLRREMKMWKVKVCILEPQAFATPLLKDMFEGKLQRLYDGAPEEVKQEYGEDFLNDYLRCHYQKRFYKRVSPNIQLVIDAVIDSVTARDPAIRYKVGTRANIFFFTLLANLPGYIQDKRF